MLFRGASKELPTLSEHGGKSKHTQAEELPECSMFLQTVDRQIKPGFEAGKDLTQGCP